MRWIPKIAGGLALAFVPGAARAEGTKTESPPANVERPAEDVALEIDALEGMREKLLRGDPVELRGNDVARERRRARRRRALAEERARILELEDSLRITRERRRALGAPHVESNEVIEGGDAEDDDGKKGSGAPAKSADELDRMSSVALTRLADLRFRSGAIALALEAYERLAARDASITWPRYQRARCLERLGRSKQAREAYAKLIEADPDDFWAKRAEWNLRFLERSDDGGDGGER